MKENMLKWEIDKFWFETFEIVFELKYHKANLYGKNKSKAMVAYIYICFYNLALLKSAENYIRQGRIQHPAKHLKSSV